MKKSSRRGAPFLILLLSGMVTAERGEVRNPFIPPGQSLCTKVTAQPLPWQVTGVAGRADRYVALLRSPDKRWQRRLEGEQLDSQWQLLTITPSRVTLRRIGCDEMINVMLSGGRYAEILQPHYVTVVAP
ncbi:MAG: hypothetical protein XXXJIFNMEKO3_02989 [Candidatus Erwinia impunctatus]|nr:hypothetical protein XXXJIFNMEKO_02989 [Culicoides impunctatus]